MNKLSFFTIFILFFVFSSCKKNKISASKNAKLITEITQNNIKFNYFSSKPKLKFDDGKTNFSSTSNLKIQKGEQVWISLTPILGIEAIRSKMTRDSIYILNRLQKEYTISSFLFLNKEFGTEINYSILESLILGDFPLSTIENLKIIEKENTFILTQIVNNVEVKIIVDKSIKRMTQLILDDKKGNKMTARYSDFIDLNNQQFAQLIQIEITQPEKSLTSVEIDHKKAKIGENDLSFPFSIPSNYQEKTYVK